MKTSESHFKKNTEFYFRMTIVILLIAIIVVFAMRFLYKKEHKPEAVSFINPQKTILLSLDNKTVTLEHLLKNSNVLYLAIFDFSGCYSCTGRALDDLRSLKKEKKDCIAITIHDNFNDFKEWAQMENFNPIYMVKKNIFYEFIKTPYVPVIIELKKGKIEFIRFISL